MEYTYIRREIKDQIAVITYSNGKVNAIGAQGYKEIAHAFQEINGRNDVRVVIFKTQGKGFLGGNDVADIRDHNRENHPAYQKLVGDAVMSIINCKVPVIGMIQGYAIGVGTVITAAFDVAVASENAWFNMPELSLGVVAGASFAMTMLPEKVVRYMCFTGEKLSAYEMYEYGAVNFVVPLEELEKKVFAIAEKIKEQPPFATSLFKECMNMHYNHQSDKKFQLETAYTGRLFGTEEKIESAAAFFEKRKPRYN